MLPSPLRAAPEGNRRVAYEVADVVRAYGAEFGRTHAPSAAHRRVLQAIASCRTAVLGGHVEACDGCGYQRIAYNSCRNRHCPKCQAKETARWMAAEQALLLPVPYFHVVFTLPHRLNPLMRVNRRRLCTLLFRAASATLRTFARDPCHLGAEPAITMVLHTWGQTLREHFHVHCVVSGGGLALDQSAWICLPKGTKNTRRPFLFPVAALSEVFRGKYLAALKRARRNGELRFVGHSAALADPVPWQELLGALAARPWVVYCKRPFAGPAAVLKYLSRYTHRVAISNQRIRFVGNGHVRLAYRDYADHDQPKELTLAATEFLRRFLLHIVPTGFMRIRHYGLTANCQRARKLARCRELLGLDPSPPTTIPPAPSTPDEGGGGTLSDTALKHCPNCGARLRITEILSATRSDFFRAPIPPDTS